MSTINLPVIGEIDKRVAIVIGGGAVLFIGYQYWSASQAPAADTNAITDTGTTTADPFTNYGTGYGAADMTTTDPVSTAITTDAQWVQEAVDGLEASGTPRADTELALGLWLQKSQLSAAQVAIVIRAVGAYGYPPVSGHLSILKAIVAPSPAPNTPAKKPAAKPSPSARKSVKVKAGDTLSKIAHRYAKTLAAIKRLNPHLTDKAHRNGDLIHPGETVYLS